MKENYLVIFNHDPSTFSQNVLQDNHDNLEEVEMTLTNGWDLFWGIFG